MRLNHDRLMALYCVEDSEGRGYLRYYDLVQRCSKMDGLARFQANPKYDMELKRFNVLHSLHTQLAGRAGELATVFRVSGSRAKFVYKFQ